MLKHMGPAAELATHLSFAQKYYNHSYFWRGDGSRTESGLLFSFDLWNVITTNKEVFSSLRSMKHSIKVV